MAVQLTVNRTSHRLEVDPDTPLPWVLRDELQLTGTKYGCGLGAALYNEIVLEAGRVAQSNFDGYRPLRMAEMPDVEVAVIRSREAPTGVGEPGTPPVAPAVANAWYALTGERVRRLPFAAADG